MKIDEEFKEEVKYTFKREAVKHPKS